jgi:membrane complex biogenesis BtpA family protein
MVAARADAEALAGAGVDGIMVENFGDVPFHPDAVPPEAVSALTMAIRAVQEMAPGIPVGVNVLRNDARSALGIAAVTGAAFMRVNVHSGTMWTDQGPISGRAHETLRVRSALGAEVAILADVHVKHATPLPGESLADAARDTWFRGLADVVVVSGAGTGLATDPARIEAVRKAVPGAPVWVGSGVTPESLPALAGRVQGLIVGSWLQVDGQAGRRVDPARAHAFMETARAAAAGKL